MIWTSFAVLAEPATPLVVSSVPESPWWVVGGSIAGGIVAIVYVLDILIIRRKQAKLTREAMELASAAKTDVESVVASVTRIDDHVTKPNLVVTQRPDKDKPMGLDFCVAILTNTASDPIYVVPADGLSVNLQEPLPGDLGPLVAAILERVDINDTMYRRKDFESDRRPRRVDDECRVIFRIDFVAKQRPAVRENTATFLAENPQTCKVRLSWQYTYGGTTYPLDETLSFLLTHL